MLGWLLLTGRALPDPVWIFDFIAVFPVFASAVVSNRHYWHTGGASVVSPTLARSKTILIGTAAVFVVLAVTALAAAAAPDVTVPGVVSGHYVLNNHGSLTPVSRSLYDRAHVQEEGQFVALAVLFALLAIANLGTTGERILARHRPIGAVP